MPRLPIVLVLALGLSSFACSDGEERTAPEPAPIEQEDLDAFCDRADHLTGERPESYVGSDEHVEDTAQLAELAPADIRPHIERYRDFLAHGLGDDPDTNLTENWPARIRSSVEKTQAYLDERC